MTTPRDRMPRPCPPSDAYAKVTEIRPPSRFRRRSTWRVVLIDGPAMPFGVEGVTVKGTREEADAWAVAELRRYLMPDEQAATHRVHAPGGPKTGPSSPSGQVRAR